MAFAVPEIKGKDRIVKKNGKNYFVGLKNGDAISISSIKIGEKSECLLLIAGKADKAVHVLGNSLGGPYRSETHEGKLAIPAGAEKIYQSFGKVESFYVYEPLPDGLAKSLKEKINAIKTD